MSVTTFDTPKAPANRSFSFVAAILPVSYLFNSALLSIGPLSLGQGLVLVSMLFLAVPSLTRGRNYTHTHVVLCWIMITYWLCTIIGGAVGVRPPQAENFLITSTGQLLLALMILVCFDENWVKPFLVSAMIVSLFMALLNVFTDLTDVAGLAVRSLVGRKLYGLSLGASRVITLTPVYGQFGYILFVGFWPIIAWLSATKPSRRWLVLPALALLTLAVVSTQSRSLIVSLLASTFVFAFLRARAALRPLVVVGTLILAVTVLPIFMEALISIQTSTVNGRLNAFSDSFKIIPRYPFGTGWGGFEALSGLKHVLHNTFLSAFVTNGVIGGSVFLGLYLWALCDMAWYTVFEERDWRVIGLVCGMSAGFVAANLYNGLTEYTYTTLPIMAILLVYALRRGRLQASFGK